MSKFNEKKKPQEKVINYKEKITLEEIEEAPVEEKKEGEANE